jgi:acetylglutamate kinase
VSDPSVTWNEREAKELISRASGENKVPGLLESKTVVIKCGGELFLDKAKTKSFCEELRFLKNLGVRLVLVHGGGPQISDKMEARGLEPKFVGGLRVTDHATLELTKSVLLGDINAGIVSTLIECGVDAVGLSGVDAGMFRVEVLNPELGIVGKMSSVSAALVSLLLRSNYLPVVASLGVTATGTICNINADHAAGFLAGALEAELFLVVTNVEGLYRDFSDKHSLLAKTNLNELRSMRANGVIHSGMIPKLEGIEAALSKGVPRAAILDGRVPYSMIKGIFQPDSVGTLIQR